MRIRKLNKLRRIHKTGLHLDLKTTETHDSISEIFTNKLFKICHQVHIRLLKLEIAKAECPTMKVCQIKPILSIGFIGFILFF